MYAFGGERVRSTAATQQAQGSNMARRLAHLVGTGEDVSLLSRIATAQVGLPTSLPSRIRGAPLCARSCRQQAATHALISRRAGA